MKLALCIGDVIDDIVVRPLEAMNPDTDTKSEIVSSGGGSAANTACWISAYGAGSRFFGTVGASDVNRLSIDLEKYGVQPRLIGSETENTGAIVLIIDGNQRHMYNQRGANWRTSPEQITDQDLQEADHLHLSGYSIIAGGDSGIWQSLIARAKTAGLTVSLDPGSASLISNFGVENFLAEISGVDYLLPNLDEAELLSGISGLMEVTKALGEKFSVVATTASIDGVALAITGAEVQHFTAPQISAVDPTGAGDAFSGGFIAAAINAKSFSEAVLQGIESGRVAVSKMGARPPIDVR